MNMEIELKLKNSWLLLIVIFCSLGCKNETQISVNKGSFDGLYDVEYEGYEQRYVWIFTENTRYVLYRALRGSSLEKEGRINYETPTHYFIEKDNFFSCGIETVMKAKSLEKCKKGKTNPQYKIISIDTIKDVWKYQRIVLEEYNSKSHEKIILKKNI